MEDLIFMGDNPQCVALRQIYEAPRRFYHRLGFNPVLKSVKDIQGIKPKYLIGNRVSHGTGGGDALTFVTKATEGSYATYYLDDYLQPTPYTTNVIEAAHSIAVANEHLRQYVRKWVSEKPIMITDTHIDVQACELLNPIKKYWPLPNDNKLIKLWYGSVGAIGAEFLGQLCQKLPPGVFQLMAIVYNGPIHHKFRDNRVPKAIYQRLEWKEYIATIKAADILLQPCIGTPNVDDNILAGKSPIKWLNAGAVKTLFVSHSKPPYTRIVRNMVNGLLADTLDQWVYALEEYARDRTIFDSIINIAFEEVKRDWNTRERTLDYIRAFTGREVSYE